MIQAKNVVNSIFTFPLEDDEEIVNEISKIVKPKKLSRKKKLAKNQFIDDEAELSGSASSDDEQNSRVMEEFEASFVDDGTQRVSMDQKAMYLQSIKSPQQPKRKKLPKSKPTPALEDIFSQPVTDTMLFDDYDMSGIYKCRMFFFKLI